MHARRVLVAAAVSFQLTSMSYASEELRKLPVTEAVHKIKQHVRREQELKQDVKLKPSRNPPEGLNIVIHKEIDAAKPLEVDISLDRNVSEILIQTKKSFWTKMNELGADVTLACITHSHQPLGS